MEPLATGTNYIHPKQSSRPRNIWQSQIGLSLILAPWSETLGVSMALCTCVIPPETEKVQEKKSLTLRNGKRLIFLLTLLTYFGASIILC